MEKIYMEDNNKKGKKSVIDVSVVLSFAVAIFAIFSLVMADLSLTQRTNVSYAADDESSSFPSDFTLNIGDVIIGLPTLNSANSFTVTMYMANNDPNKPIFCMEYGNESVHDGTSYEPDNADIEDAGLIYLLNHSYANGVTFVNADTAGVLAGDNLQSKTESAKMINSWITQAAIWDYLYQKNGISNTNSYDHIGSEYNAFKEVVLLRRKHNNVEETIYDGANLYTTYVHPLAMRALDQTTVAADNSLTVSLESTEISRDENKNFYFSAPITITGTSSLQSYSIALSGIEGAIAVYENGEAVYSDGATGGQIAHPGSPFRIRIPSDKIKEEVQTVTVNVNGKFSTLAGKTYHGTGANSGDQKTLLIRAGSTTKDGSVAVEFYGAPDTGMSTAQTIYFIGLIVLLCGVGIVYANAKPVQVKQ